jgi:peptidoglycan hydrolase-like protein with peptidoglycan-binding domain
MSGKDVNWLHVLLNHRLGPPDEQLPIDGPGANDFGPKTEAKVKRFQEINKIDVDTDSYKDGVVGQHTWIALHEVAEIKSNALFVQQNKLKLPDPPVWPRPGTSPTDIVPKLTLKADGMMQVQLGEGGSIPFDGSTGALAHQLSVGFLVLGKVDGSTEQGQIGFLGSIANDWVKPNAASNAVGIFGSIQTRNLPGSGSRLTWTAQVQQALWQSLQNGVGGGSSVTSLNVTGNISIKKDSQGNDVVQITGQTGPYVEFDTPNMVNRDWKYAVGWGAFLGVTISYTSYTPFF